MPNLDTLSIVNLRESYRTGHRTPADVMDGLLEKSAVADTRHVWITRLSREQVMAYVDALDPGALHALPLYGIPFVIKDNIDLAGVPTTAACPEFAYTPIESATVVQKLLDAGAIPLGKTNMDQFATGLVGTRSPYGACRNAINQDYVSGGSSSGSAVAVAAGLASFSLGTDTAGSGRVPAAFNGLVGLKPSNGRISTRGIVAACRSLDCVSIFALSAADAATVLEAAQGFDPLDPYSRRIASRGLGSLRFGVPRPHQLRFYGDSEYERLFDLAVQRLENLGGSAVEIDFAPFLEAARLLYDGPWIAERYAAVGAFIEAHPGAAHPITRQIIEAGKDVSAAAAFRGAYRLKELERLSETAWSAVDLMVTPTAGTIYRLAEVEADPIASNANLGYYTNFMNLFDLCGVAVPAGFRADGMPFGVTLVGHRAAEAALLEVAGKFAGTPSAPSAALRDGYLAVAVCGAHMEGLPLNAQLRDRGGYFLRAASTAPRYRLFALPGGPPHRPGLTRVSVDGAAVALELWALPTEQWGSFLAHIPAPLGLSNIELDSGTTVMGFVCEAYATLGAADITSFGGWRAYIAATRV